MKGRRQCDPINGCGRFYKQQLDACPSCKTPEAFSNFKAFNPLDWIYDLECYPNVFTASFKHMNTGAWMKFEISQWKDDLQSLLEFLYALKQTGCRLIGFNNIGYDYPLLHYIIEHRNLHPDASDIYDKSAGIIATPWERRWDNIVWDSDVHIQQIDLYKIHHFDNEARRTGLKVLEFNMRSDNIEDLPFTPGESLTFNQVPILIKYNDHDVDETEDFAIHSIEMIEFREQLSKKHNRNFLNHSDKKIGTDLFINELEKTTPGSCYSYDTGRRQPRQTWRDSIALKDVILPYIKFKEPEFERIKQWLSSQVITETKGIFKDLSCTINGFKYVFGVGGIHGSIDSAIVCSDDNYIIVDWDVSGYYPEIGSVNHLYPEHLSEQFCVVNEALKQERKQYKKGTPLNLAIKLARNGAFGDSNMIHSPFYDPQYTMSITVNGQLLLCMLAQYLIDIPDLQMIQVNTDGLTIRCPRIHVGVMESICEWWEKYTCLELKHTNYKRMFIRDVNNYIAEKESGEFKRKGAYCYVTPMDDPNTEEVLWHKNHSALIIPKAAEVALVHGQCINDFIINHSDIMDFMLRAKVGRSDQLVTTNIFGQETKLQRITRYYIAKTGGALTKISPPAKGYKVGTWKRANGLTDGFYDSVIDELESDRPYDTGFIEKLDANGLLWDKRINTKNYSMYEIRRTNLEAGWLVATCNNIKQADRSNINYEYYIKQAEKLVNPLRDE